MGICVSTCIYDKLIVVIFMALVFWLVLRPIHTSDLPQYQRVANVKDSQMTVILTWKHFIRGWLDVETP